jgi:hypothetical protein
VSVFFKRAKLLMSMTFARRYRIPGLPILGLLCVLTGALPARAQITHKKGTNATTTNCTGTCSTFTFPYTPNATGQIIVFGVSCSCAGTVTAVSMSGSSYTFHLIDGVTHAGSGWNGDFWAQAPNTSATTLTVTWTGATGMGGFSDSEDDEFAGVNTSSPIDAHISATAVACTANVTPNQNNDMLWGFCEDSSTGVGTGFTQGATDGGGDISEYKILVGGSGVSQTVNYTGSSSPSGMFAVALAPAGGAACVPRLMLMHAGGPC